MRYLSIPVFAKNSSVEVTYCHFFLKKRLMCMAIGDNIMKYGFADEMLPQVEGVRYYCIGTLDEMGPSLQTEIIQILKLEDWDFSICDNPSIVILSSTAS
ncbi:hypothetical protein [Xanthocytophaga agilis]|uniref:Uncharacterized protein n=1 Tax=Xanthocytophaga agilis TaxID=3048010 RepID=A0AAE3UEV3_9BACT|nr:hypothetical protein [Xanthocytophaga agilis]MDJ1501736.1 hypothetical protein [Xanthocytophaga agilis]